MAQINSWPEWECVRKIGEGSFARVYEIQRIEEGKIYKAALKVITIPQNQVDIDDVYSEGMSIEEVDKYFGSLVKDITNEISLMSDLKGYTNIVSYEDHKVIKHSDDIGWDILIRMELLTPLQEWIKNHSMDEKTVIKLGCDISEALKLCHKNKIIHRDIKPENIFVNKNGDFKLGDFGIAKVTEKTISVMSQKGTYSYMAPEVYKGEEYNETVDIYSLGIVLYRFMNQGRLPFLPFSELKYSDRAIAFEKRMSGEPISEPMNGSQELKKVIMKSIQYKAGMRYKNASEFFDALEKCKKYNENFNLENDITITMDDATVNKDKTIDNGEVRERTLKIKLKWLILVIIVAMGIIFAIVFENKGEEELPTTAPKNDELQQTSELVSDEEAVSEKITVKPEWLKYREMTYEKFKNQTGVIAKHESDNYYVATLSNNEIRVIFHAVLGLEDSTSCYRLEGKIDSLLNGIGDTMTINELVSALAWENGIEPTYDVEATADYKTMYGQYFGVAFAKISFDSDGDGNIDADLHVSLDESGNVNTFSNAWLSLDVIVENVIGMEKDDAVACLERQGFIVDCIEEYSSAENQGKVTAIAHGPGAPLKFGTRINVYVGKGVEEVSIADRYIPLFQYEGYLDECEEWANNDIFSQKDYDADGIVDKIYREVDEVGEYCNYEFRFGNGNVLKVDAQFPTYESIAVTTADLTDNSRDEIILYTGNITGTGWREYGNLVIYGWNGEIYKEIELPFEMDENYTRYLKVNYVCDDSSNFVDVKIPTISFEKSIYIDNHWWEYEYYSESYVSDSYDECVWQVYVQDNVDRDTLICKINLFSYKHPGGLEVYLEYLDGKFVIGDVLYLEENDTPGNQYSIDKI